MKRLIDAYSLIEYIRNQKSDFDCTAQSSNEMVEFVEECIRMQPTIICVSDDFRNGCGKICTECGVFTRK